jgi:substrate import-associated zinc metallohydrolase lipoprotein
MKLRIVIYSFLFFFVLTIPACQEDRITNSNIEIPEGPQSELDKWIDENFRIPYNINVLYQWNSAEVDVSHELVPPNEEVVFPFLKSVLKVWLTPYIQVANTKMDFMKDYTCRSLVLVGSGSYNQGSVTLGLASNGYKITLYTVNQFGKGLDLQEYFRVMHHEFGHILNQRKAYGYNFQKITGKYSADWTSLKDNQARELGFISAYARSADTEDFVEVLSFYITYTEDEWQKLLNTIKDPKGKEYILLKLQFVKSYMKDSYGVDILKLREAVTKAISEAVDGNLEINNDNE